MKVQVCALYHKKDVLRAFEKIGVDIEAWDLMWSKSETICLYIDDLSMAGGNVLKQSALSSGAEAAVSGGVIDGTSQRTKVLLMGTRSQLQAIARKISIQQFRLKELAEKIEEILLREEKLQIWKMRGKELILDRPRIIGVINVTSDSFYEESRNPDFKGAVSLALEMEKQGADMIDVGGESSRPGSSPLSFEEESARILPVVKEIREKTSIPISVDTVHSETAEMALEEGCDAVNDISGFTDIDMIKTAVKYDAGAVLMHKKGSPLNMQVDPQYEDVFEEVRDFLEEKAQHLESSGLSPENIVLDPGFGFGKTLRHNLTLLRRLSDLRSFLEKPVYVGLSRKSMIGALGGGETPALRLSGSISLSVLALTEGVFLFRTHDVLETKKALETAFNAIREGRWV
ncbi:dihydropteroate synthase [candidate division WOR-3 bacterium]|nr:dihydropteroate synthase [candidate division WOR-3 bacterium]